MNIDEFWKIIEKVKESDEPEEIVCEELKKLTPNEIASYQEHFDSLHEKAYQWSLWGAAYVIEGGCSDDGFMDFRYGLISKGKHIYENALNNPDSLADLGAFVEISNESFGYTAHEVYEEITGNEIPRKELTGSREPIGQEWDFEDEAENINRLPRLMKLHW
ncbi:MAG: DUF4240 domain-containing protein [Candidatus Thiodiazotropha sp. (ex Lucinoma kastoroae)]|nr:DUF4240 domain-containing protein [Candidatus Thiodiazotropha sp. (ex Lucinoma kastoroae)]